MATRRLLTLVVGLEVVAIALVVAGLVTQVRPLVVTGAVALAIAALVHLAVAIVLAGTATAQSSPGSRLLVLAPPLLLGFAASFHAFVTGTPASLPAGIVGLGLGLATVVPVMSDPPWWASTTSPQQPQPQQPPAWWNSHSRWWRAQVRAGPVLVVGGLAATLVTTVAWGQTVLGWQAFPGEGRALVIAAVGVIAAVVVVASSIVLWNRPRRLVSPHLRDQPGALADTGYE